MNRVWQFRLCAFGVHLLCSALIASGVFWLLYGLWYPEPLFAIASGKPLFLLMVGCDVVLGPMLTLVVFNINKPHRELRRDIGIIALVQLTALIYGAHVMYAARPVYIVYNVGQFNVVQAQMITDAAYRKMPSGITVNPLLGPEWIGAVLPTDTKRQNAVLFSAVSGGPDVYQLPEFFVPYVQVKHEIAKRALTPHEFIRRYGGNLASLQAILAKHNAPGKDHGLMPVLLRGAYAVAWRRSR